MLYTDLLNIRTIESITVDNITYPSIENAFQATRFVDLATKRKFMYFTPNEAAYKGSHFRTTVKDWSYHKYDFMYKILKTKLEDSRFRNALLDTDSEEIIITNTQHENDWGVCTCPSCRNRGQNNLGKLLMQLRNELHNS